MGSSFQYLLRTLTAGRTPVSVYHFGAMIPLHPCLRNHRKSLIAGNREEYGRHYDLLEFPTIAQAAAAHDESGGEPLLTLDRTLSYIDVVRRRCVRFPRRSPPPHRFLTIFSRCLSSLLSCSRPNESPSAWPTISENRDIHWDIHRFLPPSRNLPFPLFLLYRQRKRFTQ